MQYYSMEGLKRFGIGEPTLKDWRKKNILFPSTWAGKREMFTEADLDKAAAKAKAEKLREFSAATEKLQKREDRSEMTLDDVFKKFLPEKPRAKR